MTFGCSIQKVLVLSPVANSRGIPVLDIFRYKMASQQVRWKMAEVQRTIQALARDAELYEKEFQVASNQAQEVSKIISTLKQTGSISGDDYAESTTSLDLTSDTGSVCSSETTSDIDLGYSKPKFGSSLYDVDEKPAASYSSSGGRTRRGNERFRARKRSQHEIKIA